MSYFKINVRLTKRGFLVLLIPYLTGSTWYYLFSNRMLGYVPERLGATSQTSWVNAFFNFSIVISILAGCFFVDRVDKLRIIYMCAAILPVGTILLAFASNPATVLMLLFLLGAIFGMSLLAYCSYFCRLTNNQERGRVGGTIIFVSLLFYPIFLSLSFNSFGALVTFVFLGVCTFMIHLLKPREKASLTTNEGGSTVQSNNKSLLLYLIPWLIYCSVNGTLANVVTNHMARQFGELLFQAQVLQYLTASFGALMGGMFADRVGRKAALLIGLSSYGGGAALTGLASTPLVFIFSAVLNGLSWGIFLVVFTLVVWGDLSEGKNCAPFYAAGFIPFFLSESLGYLVLPKISYVSAMYVPLVSILLIFLSRLPTIFAKELRQKASESKKSK